MLKSCFTCDHFDSCTLICKFADFITNNVNSTISNECKNWVQKTEEKSKEIANEMVELAHYSSVMTPDEQRNNIMNVVDVACMKMTEWKDEQHKQELIRIYNFVSPYLTPEAINDLKIIIGI